MPEAPTAPPPAAPDAPAAAPVKQINVSQMPAPAAPIRPAKPGSARDRMRQTMEKQFGGVVEAPASPAEPKPDPKPAVSPRPAEDETAPAEAVTEAKPATPPSAETPAPEAKKVSPWKLVDQFKERATRAEQRVLELEKEMGPESDRQARAARMEAAEKRLQELEQEIRYVNYSKSKEFQEQYQKPYEEAWSRAMGELKEITLQDPTTQQKRPVSDQDLIELVNLPLGRAREIADQVFGPFSDDVMAHRKAIRELFEKQHSALEKAKTEGATREQQMRETFQRVHQQISSTVKQTWDQVNATILEDAQTGGFFKPKEGNQEWNNRLEKGFKLVDQAFAENPMDPRLNPEQRAAIIKRHAAVRNRAAGWGPLRHENTVLAKKVAELESELKQYKESTPSPSPTATRSTAVSPSTGGARASVMGALQKLAH